MHEIEKEANDCYWYSNLFFLHLDSFRICNFKIVSKSKNKDRSSHFTSKILSLTWVINYNHNLWLSRGGFNVAGGFYCKGSVVGLLKIASSEDSIISRDMIRKRLDISLRYILNNKIFVALVWCKPTCSVGRVVENQEYHKLEKR